jgi:hypothetical protein
VRKHSTHTRRLHVYTSTVSGERGHGDACQLELYSILRTQPTTALYVLSQCSASNRLASATSAVKARQICCTIAGTITGNALRVSQRQR